jgi:peptidyl-prolyl cis-trans isomerase A (cyclophilin A)
MRFLLLLATVGLLLGADPAPTGLVIRTTLGDITCRLFPKECPVTVSTICGLAEGSKPWTDPATGQQVQRPFYDGLGFHRVVPGFMIQGGCPLGTGKGGPGFSFADEINAFSLGLDREKALTGDQLNPQCAYMGDRFVKLYIQPQLAAKGIGPTATPAERNAAIAAILPTMQDISLMRFYSDLGYHYSPALPASHRPVRGSLAMANSGPDTNGSQFFINLGDTPHLTGKHTIFGEVTAGLEVAAAIAAVPRDGNDRPTAPVIIIGIRPVGSTVPWPTAK